MSSRTSRTSVRRGLEVTSDMAAHGERTSLLRVSRNPRGSESSREDQRQDRDPGEEERRARERRRGLRVKAAEKGGETEADELYRRAGGEREEQRAR